MAYYISIVSTDVYKIRCLHRNCIHPHYNTDRYSNMGIPTATENNKPLTSTSTHLSDYGTFISQDDDNKSKDCDNKKSTHNNANKHVDCTSQIADSTDLEHQETNSLICRQRHSIFCTSFILRNKVSVARDILCK